MNYFIVFALLPVFWSSVHGQGRNVCNVCNCSNKTIIDCDHRGLTSFFYPVEWNMTSRPDATFVEATLSYNFIGHVLQIPALKPLLTIEKLVLNNNKIVKIDNMAFKNLARLTELDLSNNQLTTGNLDPDAFKGPFNAEYYEPLPIRKLDLSRNELHSLNALLFIHLPHLRNLNLERNPFKIIDQSTVMAISSLYELEILNLSYLKLRELPMGFLHSVKELKELILTGNYLKEVPSQVLFESHNLAVLNIDENPIKVISTERPFPVMPSLRQLHISRMAELTRIEDSSLSGLKGLEYLKCEQNEKLDFISSLAFARNDSDTTRPNITQLYLNDNALRYLNKSMLPFYKMKTINLLGNRWSCDCENQWMISELVPALISIRSPLPGLVCSGPPALEGSHFLALYRSNYQMRCLDYYGNRPENDSIVMIAVFSVIIALMVVGLVVVWKMKIGTCRQTAPTHYSRAFYKPAESDDKY